MLPASVSSRFGRRAGGAEIKMNVFQMIIPLVVGAMFILFGVRAAPFPPQPPRAPCACSPTIAPMSPMRQHASAVPHDFP